ncbi:MAG: hypothetical protein JWO04_1561 [Gammaproteobacteria bacterium]|nr:hypothetical protein [Gammaproteobacteria bacterium]
MRAMEHSRRLPKNNAPKRPQHDRPSALRALWPGLLLLLALPAVAVEGGDELGAYREASSRFGALVAAAELKKTRQQLQTEEATLLISELSDEKRFLKSESYAVSELGNLVELCGMANKAVMSLALFDLKSHLDPKGNPQALTRQTIALMQQNAEAFGPQLRHLHPFLIRCLAKEVPPITEFMLSLKPEQFTGERRKGLEQVRTGMVELFVGALQSVSNPSYDER